MKISDVTIMQCDKRTKNNVVYPRKEIEHALKKWDGKLVPGTIGNRPNAAELNPQDIQFTVSDLYIDDAGLVRGTMNCGKRAAELIAGHDVCTAAAGLGHLHEDGVAYDYSMNHVFIALHEDAAYDAEVIKP